REAARLVAPDGRLLIVDFAPHTLEFLRTDHAHRRLGFRADTVETWLTGSGLSLGTTRTIAPDDLTTDGDGDGDDRLTVSIWVGNDTDVTHVTPDTPSTGEPTTPPHRQDLP